MFGFGKGAKDKKEIQTLVDSTIRMHKEISLLVLNGLGEAKKIEKPHEIVMFSMSFCAYIYLKRTKNPNWESVADRFAYHTLASLENQIGGQIPLGQLQKLYVERYAEYKENLNELFLMHKKEKIRSLVFLVVNRSTGLRESNYSEKVDELSNGLQFILLALLPNDDPFRLKWVAAEVQNSRR